MVSERDRERMAAIAASAKRVERNDEPDPAAVAATVAWANGDRARRGIAPLAPTDERPELELYRRARALGLSRRRG